jgi:2-methylcitrate dehydratase PrpD
MSTRYIAAVQLVDREVLFDQYKEGNLNRDVIWELVEKTSFIGDPEFDKLSPWYTKVTIEFVDGKMLVEEAVVSKTVAPLMPGDKIREKWRMLTDGIMDAGIRDELEQKVLKMETVVNVTEITKLLGEEIGGVLE